MLNQIAGSRPDGLLLHGASLLASEPAAAAPLDTDGLMSPPLMHAFGGVVGDARANPLWPAGMGRTVPWWAQQAPGPLPRNDNRSAFTPRGTRSTPASPTASPTASPAPAATAAPTSPAALAAPAAPAAEAAPAAQPAPAAPAADTTPAAPAKPQTTYLTTYPDGTRISLDDSEMDAIAVLQRHRDDGKFKLADIQEKIDDPKTPPDLKKALQKIKDDPTLAELLDTADRARKGKLDSLDDGDGKIGTSDIDALGDLDAMKAFNAQRAKAYEANYVPSESKSNATQGREITANDAAREFYLYSDNLPKHIDEATLHDIVEGNLKGGKCPPQVMAAAQFYLDHPAAWKKLSANGDGRGQILDQIVATAYLTPEENETIDTLEKNRDLFFGKTLKRGNLEDMVKDPNASAEVKKAAQQLLDDPLLFGMLDNGMKGSTPKSSVHVDDGKICAKDFDGFLKRLTTRGKAPPSSPPSTVPSTPAAVAALQDMNDGAKDDPLLKKPKGGNPFVNFLKSIGHILAKVGSIILHAVSVALSFLGKIPILGPIFSGLSVVAEAGAGGLNILDTAIEGGNIKKALNMFGLGVAGAALGAILPGAGRLLMKGVEKIGETAAGRAIGRGVQAVADKVVAPVATAARNGVARVTAPIVSAGQRAGAAVRSAGSSAAEAAGKPIAAMAAQTSKVIKDAAARLGIGDGSRSAEELAERAARKAEQRALADARSAGRKAALVKAYQTVTAPVRRAARTVGALRDQTVAGFNAITDRAAAQLALAGERVGDAASRVGRFAAAPFVAVGRRVGGVAEQAATRVRDVAGRAADRVGSTVAAGGEQIAAAERRLAYKLGWRTPEGDAEKAALKAARKAEKAEARAVKDAEKAAAKKAREEEKAARKAKKEEEKKARRERDQANQNGQLGMGSSFFGIVDISVMMARLREIQRAMRQHPKDTIEDKPASQPAAITDASLKALHDAA